MHPKLYYLLIASELQSVVVDDDVLHDDDVVDGGVDSDLGSAEASQAHYHTIALHRASLFPPLPPARQQLPVEPVGVACNSASAYFGRRPPPPWRGRVPRPDNCVALSSEYFE